LFVNADDKSSGTGGFILISESTLPVLKDLNNSDVRLELGLEGDYKVVQFRKNTKDDASCLNLNRISQPHIIGVSPEMLEGRFSFATLTDYLNTSNPWASLNKEIQGGIIPAIADQTVIKWGLGLNVGDTLAYTNEKGKQIKLLLVGGLANSVFQGHIIISDNNFISNFPTHGGTNLFLIDGNRNDQENITKELQRTFRDYGWEMSPAPERLAEFNSIENTYLSIFMVMGALGLLLGTIGLGIMLVRSIQERSREIALLKAVGIGRKLIIKLFIKEYMLLLTMGILSGLITATISTLPALLSPNTDISLSTILIILCILFINGFTWIVILTRVFTGVPDINKVLRND
jgi:ABC-type antimicrobial peptide transport system permease subunit